MNSRVSAANLRDFCAEGRAGVKIDFFVSLRESLARRTVPSQLNFVPAIWWEESTFVWRCENLCLKDYSRERWQLQFS